MAQPTLIALNVLSPHSWLSGLGAFGIFLVLFLETGLLVGIVLPGDSLLFTAGLLCTTRSTNTLHLNLGAVLIAAVAGALLGAQVGYAIGRRLESRLTEHDRQSVRTGAQRSREWLERYGPVRAVVLARFIPVVRTVMNPLAGIARMPLRTFTVAQVGGGLLWSLGVTLAGYWLGSHITNVDHYLLPIIAVVVVLSLIPLLIEVRRQRKGADAR